jgi:hypothetical protein
MEAIRLSLMVLFHPADSFRRIKSDRSRFDYKPIFVILFLLIVVRVAYIYLCHFPLALIQPRDTNIFLEIVKLILPVVSWAVSCYAVTTIMDGGSLMRETMKSSVYCMMPYIYFTIPLAILSHVLGLSEMMLFRALTAGIWIWVALLFLISIKVMNEYTVLQTIGISLITIITLILIWAAFLLLATLTGQLIDFVRGFITELRFFLR